MAKTWLLCAILVTVWLLLCTVQMNFKLEQMINYMVPLVSFVFDWMKLQNPFPKLQMIHSSNALTAMFFVEDLSNKIPFKFGYQVCSEKKIKM
jgi:hypothetical protein